MANRKFIAKMAYGFIALLIVAVVVILVYQQRLIRQIADNEQQAPQVAVIPDPNTLPDIRTQPFPVAEGGREQLSATVDDLRYQLEASEEELDMAREDLAREQSRPGNISNIVAMDKEMRENPSVRAMERRIQENGIAENYRAFFERLGLSDEKKQAFITLLVDYEMQKDDVSMDLMDQSLPEEKRNEMVQLLEDRKAEFEKQASALLGPGNYEEYNAYKQRGTERLFVHGQISPLSADLGLSDEKELELIDAMYEARMEVEAEYGLDRPIVVGAISLNASGEEMDRQLEIYEGYIESARGVLSESQAGQFEARINEMKERQKVVRSFMGGGGDNSQ